MKAFRFVAVGALIAALFVVYTSHRFGSGPAHWVNQEQLHITEAAGPQQLDPEEQNNIDVYKRVSPAVVNITSTTLQMDFFFGAVPQQGAGSGFIIDKEGHILTNYHVVQGTKAKLEVTLQNKKHFPAEIIGLDETHDLAVIKIKAPNLAPVVMGDSSHLQVGQKVYAIGNPFGMFAGTMTRGIVSSIRQVQEPNGMYIDEAIQTDAAINPGNSGGPLLNSRGEVVGINTMIASMNGGYSGIGFAIPVNAAKAVINDLVTYGRVRRPALGVRSLPIGPELAEQLGLPADYGVLIMQVVPGSAAARAGLRGGSERVYLGNIPLLVGGDLIVAIDGQSIEDSQDLAHIMDNHRAGDTVTVTIWRGQKKMDVKVTLEEAKGTASGRTA
ncbi:MAG TPA: trypsin-like peptidase domain-containing protein [candidate division Zixibacteria bacterium]|nr:trypsin-like peptidase domain-containing protein [candidate division Zixibacteria bacterium]